MCNLNTTMRSKHTRLRVSRRGPQVGEDDFEREVNGREEAEDQC